MCTSYIFSFLFLENMCKMIEVSVTSSEKLYSFFLSFSLSFYSLYYTTSTYKCWQVFTQKHCGYSVMEIFYIICCNSLCEDMQYLNQRYKSVHSPTLMTVWEHEQQFTPQQ